MGGAGLLLAVSMLGAAFAQDPAAPDVDAAGAVQAPAPLEGPRWPVRVGVQIGMASVPRPLGVEVYASVLGLVDVGLGYSALPRSLGDLVLSAASVDDAWFAMSALEATLRVHPFHGSFFLGWALGRQSLSASATRQGSTGTIDVTTLYLTPRVGWLVVLASGITLGLDLGVQVPLAVDTTATGSTADSVAQAKSIGHAAGEVLLPSLNFRIGYAL